MTERHFRVVQLDGKKVEIGGVSISSKASPGSAARKLLTSIAHHKGLKKNKKASLPKVKFCIQEYTQGSSKKVYGPYVGHYHKYTAAELKKAMTADGKVKFTMKPVVKLVKGKNMKGGLYSNENLATNNILQRVINMIPTSVQNNTHEYGKYYVVREVNGDDIIIQKFTEKKIHNFNGYKPLKLVLNNTKTIKKENITEPFSVYSDRTIKKNDILRKLKNPQYSYGKIYEKSRSLSKILISLIN
jgi:hypothetical protein